MATAKRLAMIQGCLEYAPWKLGVLVSYVLVVGLGGFRKIIKAPLHSKTPIGWGQRYIRTIPYNNHGYKIIIQDGVYDGN